MNFQYIVIFGCALLLVICLTFEIKQPDRSRLVWRILATVIAVGCFVLLIIPIQYTIDSPQQANRLTLITDGTNIDSVINITGKKYILSSANTGSLKKAKATVITDLGYFLISHPEITKLDVYGYGLSKEELKTLDRHEIKFHPSPNPGVISVNWPTKLKSTEQFQIQGIYQNSNKATKLLLRGLGTSIDSISTKANISQQFSFKDRPKPTGKVVYELIALQGIDTISRDPIPFEVMPQEPMKVLILASSPSFEYKFLKQWLYDHQYPVVFRSQISKDKFSMDFLNMESFNLNRITSTSLKKFDVLILDEEELVALSPEERSVIENAVRYGLGLMMNVSSPKPLSKLSGSFSRYELTASKEKTLSLRTNSDVIKLDKLPITQTLFFKAGLNDQPLVTNNNGKIVVNSYLNGSGKVTISSLAATYSWLLSGRKTDYTNFWSMLLTTTARKKIEVQSVIIKPQFPGVNERIQIIADLTALNKAPLVKINESTLSTRQHMELPFEWDAFFWPRKEGWNNLLVNQSEQSWYVYQKRDWLASKQESKLQSTLTFAKNSRNANQSLAKTIETIEVEVSKWWFFIGFLIAVGFLWYESRRLQNK